MKGLMVKDFYSIGNYKRVFGLLLIIYGGIGFFSENGASFIGAAVIVVLMMMSMNVFSYDESSHWDRYAVTLPLTRRTIVGARYVMAVILLVLGVVGSSIISFIIGVIQKQPDLLMTILGMAGVTSLVYLLTIAFTYPIAFRLGPEKARYAMIAGYLIPFFFIMFAAEPLARMLENITITSFIVGVGIAAVAVVTLIIFIVSYFVAVKLYEKREF